MRSSPRPVNSPAALDGDLDIAPAHSTKRGRLAVASAAARCCRSLLAGLSAPPVAVEHRRAKSEALEPRRLLTTLFGGESITYTSFDFEELPQDADDFFPVRLTVEGSSDTRVELFGATFGGQISDLSGIIDSTDPERAGPTLGGLGGIVGTSPLAPDGLTFVSEFGGVQPFNVTDFIGAPAGLALAPQGFLLNFTALATNDAGETYGFERFDEDPFGPNFLFARFNTDPDDLDADNGTPNRDPGAGGTDPGVLGNVGDAIILDNILPQLLAALNGSPLTNPQVLDPAADPLGYGDITNIFGADFASGDNDTLYLGLTVNTLRSQIDDPAPAEVDVPVLLALDISSPTSPTVSVVASDFFADEQSLDTATVAQIQAMTIVSANSDGSSPRFAFYGTFSNRVREGGGDVAVVSQTGLILVNNPSGSEEIDFEEDITPVTLFGEQPTIEAMEYRPTNDQIYAITEPGDEQQLFIIDYDDPTVIGGQETIVGTLVGGLLGSAADDETRGADIQSLTFDPTRENPFTDATGGFLAYDVTTDELLEVDPRPRGVGGAISLYNIVVTNGDENTRIIVQSLGSLDDPELQGLNGNPGPIATIGGENVEIDGNTGELYLGLKYVNEDPDVVVTLDSLNPQDLTEGTDEYSGPLYDGEVRPGFYAIDSSIGGFYFGGVVSGNVRIEGGIDTFFAGAILTGDTGLTGVGPAAMIDNFAVFGDARVIASANSIGDSEGANPAPFLEIGEDDATLAYASGVDFAIGGRISQLRSGGGMVATFDVRGDRTPVGGFTLPTLFKPITGPIQELETQASAAQAPSLFAVGRPVVPALNNDSFSTYEPVGTDQFGDATILGTISTGLNPITDAVDYYGLGVMAGQEIEIQLLGADGTNLFGILQVGIFDPDGRLVASNYDDNPQTALEVAAAPFRFKAETGGLYRIAVGKFEDINFAENIGAGISQTYALRIGNAGDVALGGVKAEQRIYAGLDNTFDDGMNLRLFQGDIGVIDSRLAAYEAIQGGTGFIRTLAGNVRDLRGSGVGVIDNGVAGWVNIRAAYNIGRIEATGEAGGAYAGDVFINFDSALDPENLADNLPTVEGVAAGDDIQVVRAARDLYGNFTVGRGIGSMVAGRDWAIAGAGAIGVGRISANVDNINDDGFIDMFSIAGNVGASTDGGVLAGPAFDAGTNGNVRYLDFAEDAIVVRDPFFGGFPGDEFIQLQTGEEFTYTDDSGTEVTVSPFPREANPDFDPTSDDESERFLNPGTLEILTYPIRGGGSVLASVRTDRGLAISSNDRGAEATAEIGNLFMSGDGRPVFLDSDENRFAFAPQLVLGNTFFDPSDPLGEDDPFDDLAIRLDGGNLDVFGITAIGDNAQRGKFTEIINNSTGEILDMTVASVGQLEAERIGIAQPRGFADILTATPRTAGLTAGQYPFLDQSYLIGIEGSLIEARADTIGNLFVGGDFGLGNVGGGTTGGGGDGDGGDGGTGDGGTGDGGTGGPGGGTGGGGTGGGGTGGAGDGGGDDGFPSPISGPGGPTVVGPSGDGIGGVGVTGGTPGTTGGTGGVGGIGLVTLGEPRGIIGRIIADARGGGLAEFRGSGGDAAGFGRDLDYRFEGIAAPIVAATPGTAEVEGAIYFVDIGEGIADGGSGDVAGGGLYAEGFITEVVGSRNADIRGDIVANEINTVRLNGGSFIGADILAAPSNQAVGNTDFVFTRERAFATGAIPGFVDVTDIADQVTYEIDLIEANGGGFINSTIGATDIDTVRVNGGYGILQSDISTVTDGRVNNVTADGFGLRNVAIDGGRNVGSVSAIGDGTLLDVTQFPQSVRFSDTGGTGFDPFSGRALANFNDLRQALGLPSDVDIRQRISETGVAENVRITGARDFGSYNAYSIRSNLLSVDPLIDFEDDTSGIGEGTAEGGESFPSTVNFGRNVEQITADETFGFQVVGGSIRDVNVLMDFRNTSLRASGLIDQVNVDGEFAADSIVRAEGPDGVINRVEAGDLFGRVRADVRLEELVVEGDLGAPTEEPINPTLPATEANIRSGGTARPNSTIGSITVGGDVLTGAFLRATGTIDSILIEGDFEEGAVIQADAIDDLEILGRNFGRVLIGS